MATSMGGCFIHFTLAKRLTDLHTKATGNEGWRLTVSFILVWPDCSCSLLFKSIGLGSFWLLVS